MSTYHLIDEPQPSTLSQITVDPIWPLLSHMLGSPFFAWIWYTLNSHALGSPTRRKEFAIIAFGVIGFFAWIVIVTNLKQNGVVADQQMPYLRLVLTLFTLIISYTLYMIQHRPFQIYEHFNGKVMKGFPFLVLAIVFGSKIQQLIVSSALRIVL